MYHDAIACEVSEMENCSDMFDEALMPNISCMSRDTSFDSKKMPSLGSRFSHVTGMGGVMTCLRDGSINELMEA